MNRSRFLVIGLCLVLTVGVILAGSRTAQGASCYLAAIAGKNDINPRTLHIKKGDCVVFMNYAGTATNPHQVKVSFKEGEMCLAATESLVGLAMDETKCLTSGWIGYGQTPSAVFTKPGTYKYEVIFKEGGSATTGRIEVK
jgi:plastocyanin